MILCLSTPSLSQGLDAARRRSRRSAFTLIELLTVVSIMVILAAVLLPALSKARRQAKTTVCQTRLRTMGQGLVMYANEYDDVLVPGRMPKVDNEQWSVALESGLKYRPTFLAMMAGQLGIPAFDDPQRAKTSIDRFGQPGDRQNYAGKAYVCPEVPSWTDERNGAFGYNYQFLGNGRLRDRTDPTSYKNWPVLYSSVRSPASCVAVADCMGTAASFPASYRMPYEDNAPGDSSSGRTLEALGNEGFNLDPPRVDPDRGEMAHFTGDEANARTALDQRHAGTGTVLWVDGHASSETLESLGYEVGSGAAVGFEGNNRFFSIDRADKAWIGW